MQEEVENRTVNLAITTTKLSARAIIAGIKKYLAHRKNKKIQHSQLFNLLCEKADDVYGGRLPVHVRCLVDETANIGQIPNLERLMATIRSREISAWETFLQG